MVAPVGKYALTPHASFEMARRGISASIVEQVLKAPEQRYAIRPGRDILQSRIVFADKTYLVRVVVEVESVPAEVVTVYRTSKIEKYWRNKL